MVKGEHGQLSHGLFQCFPSSVCSIRLERAGGGGQVSSFGLNGINGSLKDIKPSCKVVLEKEGVLRIKSGETNL